MLATYDDGSAAAVAHTFGEGRAVITGTLPGYMVGRYGCTDSAEYIVSLVREVAGLEPEVQVQGGRRADVLYRGETVEAVVLQMRAESGRSVTFADPAMAGRTLRNVLTGSVLTVDVHGRCSIPDAEGRTELYRT